MNCELVKPNEPDPKDNKRTWGRTDRKTAIGTNKPSTAPEIFIGIEDACKRK